MNLRHKRIVAKVRCEQFGKERRKNRQRTNPVKCVFDLFGDDELEEQPHNGRCIGRNSDKSERHEMTRRRHRIEESRALRGIRREHLQEEPRTHHRHDALVSPRFVEDVPNVAIEFDRDENPQDDQVAIVEIEPLLKFPIGKHKSLLCSSGNVDRHDAFKSIDEQLRKREVEWTAMDAIVDEIETSNPIADETRHASHVRHDMRMITCIAI